MKGSLLVICRANAIVEPFTVMIETIYAAITFAAVFGRSERVRLTGATELVDILRRELIIVLGFVDQRVSGVYFGGENSEDKD